MANESFFSYPSDPCSKLGSIVGDLVAAGILLLIVGAILPTFVK